MLTEKEEGKEQEKGKKSELTGTVAILFYWDLPSHVLLHVCKFPLSCLLLHLEPRCKRRDLTAALCHSQRFLLRTQQAIQHPKFITHSPTGLWTQPLRDAAWDRACCDSSDSVGTAPESVEKLRSQPCVHVRVYTPQFFSSFKMMSGN